MLGCLNEDIQQAQRSPRLSSSHKIKDCNSKRCKPGGQVVREVDFQSQGPRFEPQSPPDEQPNGVTNRRIGFYSPYLASLLRLPLSLYA